MRKKKRKKEKKKKRAPFKNEGKRSDSKSGSCMTVHNKYVVIHAMVKRDHCDDVHSSIAELQGDNAQVRFGLGKH